LSDDLRILLLGGTGRLGRELANLLPALGDVAAPSSRELDLTRSAGLRDAVRRLRPGLIVNAAAYTDVDGAEGAPELAAALNAEAPRVLAEEARRLGSVLVHYSTDFVFDGARTTAYVEDDSPAPLSVYGRTKLDGEIAVRDAGCAHLILRTSWVYAADRDSFVTRVLRWARERRTLRIVADRTGSPTWCRSLAEATVAVLRAAAAPGTRPGGSALAAALGAAGGVYHLAGSGAATQWEWAEAALRLDPRRSEQVVEELLPASTDEFPAPAARPRFSALDCGRIERAFGVRLLPWAENLRRALLGAS
jgi:dTDP-4-dehydrorhamnose reductase